MSNSKAIIRTGDRINFMVPDIGEKKGVVHFIYDFKDNKQFELQKKLTKMIVVYSDQSQNTYRISPRQIIKGE